ADSAAVPKCCGAELFRKAQRLGELRGLTVCVLRSPSVSGARVSIAERQKELAADRVVRRLHLIEDPERHEEKASSLFVGKQAEGAFGGAARVQKRFLRNGRTGRLVEVVGELGQAWFEVVRV